ncbi:MAG: TonB-dependent receptor [Vicinamibacterales bacterium]
MDAAPGRINPRKVLADNRGPADAADLLARGVEEIADAAVAQYMLLSVFSDACWVVGLAALLQLQTLTGTISDSSGAAIAGARVVAQQPGQPEAQTRSDDRGRFQLGTGPGAVMLVVSAPGFAESRTTLAAGSRTGDISVSLSPAGLADTVTVTAGRMEQRLNDVAATVSIIDRESIMRSPSMTMDDVLRQVPSFSLFRRSSSISAHPTAQGVSLRGIGPSGVSRTLVLLDGIPFNDPFGGWVAWSRVPNQSIDRIEVVEGSGANLFGNFALGGAINLLPRQLGRSAIDGTLQYGARDTPKVDVSATGVRGRWTGTLDGAAFTTNGYAVVDPAERGLVDERVSASFRNGAARLRYAFDDGSSVSMRGGLFDESRQNGKRSTIDGTPEANGTLWKFINVAARVHLRGGSQLQTAVFGDRVTFTSNFLAVPAATPPRSIGRMTLEQTVPSSSVGAMTQWSRALGRHHYFSAGADWRTSEGESQEVGLDAVTGTQPVLYRYSGGRQQNLGVFVQDVVTPLPRVSITLGIRHDRWRNSDGHNLEATALGLPSANNRPTLPDREDNVTTPRVAAVIKATDTLSLWASAGRGFRAPTLNELYRQFRVGSVLTLANETLGPERLRSIEAGARYSPSARTMIRATWFDNALKDAVANVTIATVGTAVTQQRQNLGLTRIRGLEADVAWKPASRLGFSAAYIFNDTTIEEFAASPTLVGNQLPQVPRHRGSAQVTLSDARIAGLAFMMQVVGRQFDDDQNLRRVPGSSEAGLPGYARFDLSLSRSIGRRLEVFAGAQNLFDRRIIVGTLPTTLGEPRTLSVGVRVRIHRQ